MVKDDVFVDVSLALKPSCALVPGLETKPVPRQNRDPSLNRAGGCGSATLPVLIRVDHL